MPKTRRTKINTSPARPYRNSRAVVIVDGQTDKIKGVRTRKIGEGNHARVPPTMSAGKDAKPVTIGRVLTGVPRSKPYPERSEKRGGTPRVEPGMLARAGKAIKRVVVGA